MPLGARYAPLARWLEELSLSDSTIRLGFEEVERLLGRELPFSARTHQAWWGNDPGHSQAAAWLGAGWRVSGVDLGSESVTFSRTNGRTVVQAPRIAERTRPARSDAPLLVGSPRHQAGQDGVDPTSPCVVLVACAASKVAHPAPAEQLYVSALFEKSREYAKRIGRKWFVLSAKHGLLSPSAIVDPYDLTLNELSRDERRRWAQRVLVALLPELEAGDRVVFLAGLRYREDLQSLLAAHGFRTSAPMAGLRIGEQLQWLSER